MASAKQNSAASTSRGLDALVFCLLIGSLASPVLARQGRAQLRTVHGIVITGSGAPINGAIIYLKNMKTLTVRTYISSRNGRYHFSGLNPNVDYQIHAEHRNSTSAMHTISSFDSSPDIILQLKVDRKKSSK